MKLMVFNAYFVITKLLALLCGRRDACYCFGYGFIAAPSAQQLKAALRDLFPFRGGDLNSELARLDTANGTVLDIGANVGHMAVLYSRIFKNSRIFAFEPYPQSVEYLRQNTSNKKNVEVANIGLSDAEGKLNFGVPAEHAHTLNTGRVTSMAGLWSDITDPETARVTSGDKFIKENSLNNITFIKIDVEGMELNVLDGLEETIRKNNPVICIELNGTYVNACPAILEKISALRASGYESYIAPKGSLERFKLSRINVACNYDVYLFPT